MLSCFSKDFYFVTKASDKMYKVHVTHVKTTPGMLAFYPKMSSYRLAASKEFSKEKDQVLVSESSQVHVYSYNRCCKQGGEEHREEADPS